MGHARSPFRDFKSYLRFVVDLHEDDIQLILKQQIPFFVTYEIPPGNYLNRDISELVYTKVIIMEISKLIMMILASKQNTL